MRQVHAAIAAANTEKAAVIEEIDAVMALAPRHTRAPWTPRRASSSSTYDRVAKAESRRPSAVPPAKRAPDDKAFVETVKAPKGELDNLDPTRVESSVTATSSFASRHDNLVVANLEFATHRYSQLHVAHTYANPRLVWHYRVNASLKDNAASRDPVSAKALKLAEEGVKHHTDAQGTVAMAGLSCLSPADGTRVPRMRALSRHGRVLEDGGPAIAVGSSNWPACPVAAADNTAGAALYSDV
eukprot:jgi/Tetstr1/433290/TSEL_022577.t1